MPKGKGYKRSMNKSKERKYSTYKKKYPLQKFSFGSGLSRQIVPFTRERETYFRLFDLTGSNTAPFDNIVHTDDGGAVGQISIKLSDFPGHTDFTNLFRQYKLNYMKLTFYPAANAIPGGVVRDEGGNYSNNNILIRTKLNRTGIAIGSGNTISEWSQVQAKKQWMLAQDKPTTIMCKLNQLGSVSHGDGTSVTDAVSAPRYISTNDPDVNHLGLDVRFDSCSGLAIDNDNAVWPQFRIVCKVYMTCKGVA